MPKIKALTSLHHPGVLIDARVPKSAHDYYFRHYGTLVGRRIKEVVIESSDGGEWPILVFQDGPLVSATVQCDPEGNGPGHLDIVQR